MVRLSEEKEAKFNTLAREILSCADYEQLKGFMAHGRITLYSHSVDVARLSLKLAGNKEIDDEDLVKGALLHDFYLYDWHDARIDVPLFQMHGFTHPFTAYSEASKRFKLDEKAKNIIESHMWPLTLFTIPKSKEAWLVCLADKLVAARETFTR